MFLRRSMTGSYSDFQFFASDLHVAHPPEGARRWRATSPARRQRASYMLTGGHMLLFPVRIREFWRMRRPRDVRTRAEPHVFAKRLHPNRTRRQAPPHTFHPNRTTP